MIIAKPIQILKLHGHSYHIDLEAINTILDKVGDRHVAIYSINGPLRTGKSFLLNILVRYLIHKDKHTLNEWIFREPKICFSWRGGSERETSGILIWSEPFVARTKDGTEVSVLLMDTQGSFDKHSSMHQNAVVFAISTILSSFMIINLKEQISEEILQFLHIFAGFARFADDNADDNDMSSEPFQHLMFLIRDWQFDDYEYGYYSDDHSVNGKNFKKDKLNPNDDDPEEVKYVHSQILSAFSNVGCYLMPHPGVQLARNSLFNPFLVDSDFRANLCDFVSLILKPENIAIKRIGGNPVTGNQLKAYVERWSAIFKSETIPEVKTVYEVTAQLQNEIAKSTSVNHYTTHMNKLTINGKGIPEEVFNKAHQKILRDSVKLFKNCQKMGGKEYHNLYEEKIRGEINNQYEFFTRINRGNGRLNRVERRMTIERDSLMKEIESNRRSLTKLAEKNTIERNKIFKAVEESNTKLIDLIDIIEDDKRKTQKELIDTKRLLLKLQKKQKSSSCFSW